jgi:4-carboxymuconolactone decarboxylase
MPAEYTEEEIKKAHEVLYNEGIKMRYQVAGKEYVDAALKNASNPFAKSMQEVSLGQLSASHIHTSHSLPR